MTALLVPVTDLMCRFCMTLLPNRVLYVILSSDTMIFPSLNKVSMFDDFN
jgi:hypothetical protein